MSAFLGPVHQWMYGKIQRQETLTARLVALSADPALTGMLDGAYGPADHEPLETIIDQSNIHGWLDGRVQRAELRFAAAVTALLEQDGGKLDRLTAVALDFGRSHPIPATASLAESYQAVDSILLDGMPCDGGRQVVSEDGDELVFRYDPTLHALSRQGEAGAAAFSALREALLAGMLAGTRLTLTPLGEGTYRLSKGG